jgi:large subunit ribosomal protein L5
MARLKKVYEDNKKSLKDKFEFKNIMEVPKIEKIVVNCVHRECVSNGKMVDKIKDDLASITGQKPVVARAKNSIASFKLREGQALGAFVTLRGRTMYEFLDRLINFSLPRVKDFRGLNKNSFDGRGNYTFGIKEQIMFPEINYDKIDKIRGLGITISTTAKTNEQGRELLKVFGMPFKQ